MTKILSIVWYKVLPPVFGGQKGIAHFNRELATHFPLICLCSDNNEVSAEYNYKVIASLPTGKKQFLLTAGRGIIQTTARQQKVTHIILEHPYHGLAAVRAKRKTGAQLIIHAHNIESERFRLLKKWWWRLLRRYERWTYKRADLYIFKTTTDMDFAIQHFSIAPRQCLVVPYCVEQSLTDNTGDDVRKRHQIAANEKIILFAGTLDYTPNAEAVEVIYNQIASALADDKTQKYKIIICGRIHFPDFRYLQRLSHPLVILAGQVDNIDEYFAAADVFINPVVHGGGIQTKNLDALAAGCNLVCFDNMTDPGIHQTAPSKLFTAPPGDWNGFVSQVKMAAHQKNATPPAFFEHYNWAKQMEKVVAMINR